MNQSKLIQYCQTLEATEFLRLKKFVQSPYHNAHTGVEALFQYIFDQRKALGDPESPTFQKEQVSESLFPREPYNDHSIRHLMSYLTRCIEGFWRMEDREKKAAPATLELARILQQKGLDSLAHKQREKSGQAFEQEEHRNENFFRRRAELAKERYNTDRTRSKEAPDHLIRFGKDFDLWFILNKLQAACSLIQHSRLYGSPADLGMMQEIEIHIRENELENELVVAVWVCIYQILTGHDSDTQFNRLMDLMKEASLTFSRIEMRAVYLFAVNYCIRQVNEGRKEFASPVLELYKSALETKALFDKNQLSPWTYKNIVTAAIREEDFEWAESFIKSFETFLPEKFRRSFVAFNLARLYFESERFEDAWKILYRTPVRDVVTAMDSRIILIKSAWEMGEVRYMENQIDSFLKYLRRKEVLTYHRVNHKNFLRFIKRIAHLRPYDKKARKELFSRIEREDLVTEKEWLLEKAKEGM